METITSLGFHEPPPSDRQLNAEIVRLVVREQFSELAVRSVDFLASGWEYDAYLVDQRWLLRFPRYADVARGLDWEASAIERVAAAVGDAFRVPRISHWGAPSALFPHRFFGSAFIPGIAADIATFLSNFKGKGRDAMRASEDGGPHTRKTRPRNARGAAFANPRSSPARSSRRRNTEPPPPPDRRWSPRASASTSGFPCRPP